MSIDHRKTPAPFIVACLAALVPTAMLQIKQANGL